MAYDANREKKIERLKLMVTKAFASGREVRFPDGVFIQLKRGQEITRRGVDGEEIVKATAPGIFKQAERIRYSQKSGLPVVVGHTHLKLYDFGDVDDLVDSQATDMSIEDIDKMLVGVSAKNALQSMQRPRLRVEMSCDSPAP